MARAQISVEEAIAILDNPKDRAIWLKYQVNYPEAQVGPFKLEHFVIEQDSPWRRKNIILEGMDRDTGYGTFTKLVELRPNEPDPGDRRVLWMSDTRAEILEHAPMLEKLELCGSARQAKRVLINGLGLGIIARAALNTPGVEHVDVVDINYDVIELVGGFLTKDSRITIHPGDAYKIKWPRGTRWDLAWHDIWPTISDDNIPGMDELTRKYQGRVMWQASWQRKACLAMRRVFERMNAGTLTKQEAIMYLAGFMPGSG